MSKHTDWYQPSLLQVEVIELRIRLGIIPERNHAQVMVELFEPTTGAQIAQWSRPSIAGAEWYTALEQAVEKAHEYLGRAIDPF